MTQGETTTTAKGLRVAAQDAVARQAKVTARSDSERRREVYADVEELVTPGFLSQQVSVAGVDISMRSLFPGEMGLLRHRVGLSGTGRRWKEWAVACATWVVDGQVLFGDVNAAARVRVFLSELPKSVLEALFSIYTSLYNRVRAAISRVEAYCYEDHARSAWRMAGRLSPAREEVVGIPGVSSLGMNHVQRLWMAFNIAEDDRQVWDRDWAAAKLGASATSPKGIKRLSQRDESERKLEEDRRRRVMEDTYREATGLDAQEEGGMTVYRASSAEDLVEEMNRWVRGEKDSHDLIVDSYKDRIRAKHEADKAKHEERMRVLDSLRAEPGATGGSNLVGYTVEQLRAIRGDAPLARKGTTVVTSVAPARLYEKYVAHEIPAGGISANGKAVPVPRERGGEPSESPLAKDLAGRRVHLTDDGRNG